MTTTFNYDPYYDDFDEDKNYTRILFRPGYSVQARELTQLQTSLQNQIEKFGNHIFKSGSPITGGKISLDENAYYLILKTQYNNEDIDSSLFLNKTITSYNSTKSVRAKVIAVDDSTTNPILVLKYLSADLFEEDDELKVVGQNIFAQARSTEAVGKSYVASIQEGVYYFKGQFVKVVPEFLVLELFYKIGYNATTVNKFPSYKIGIEFEENIIDEIDDTTLLDPAQGAFNYQAPGAHRFQIDTTLSKRTLDSADESSFFEVIRIVDGVKTKEIDYAVYSDLEKTMARRTYDESGNYTTDPFILSLEEGDSANGKFTASLDPGKAYVAGYEFQTIAKTNLEINRARETLSVEDFDLPTNYTSFLVVNNIQGTIDIAEFPQVDIHCCAADDIVNDSPDEYYSTKIGSARVSMVKYYGATDDTVGTSHKFSVNVFDVNTTPITGTLAASGHTTTTITLPSGWNDSATANCYANMYFRITDAGGTNLSPIRITEYDTGSKELTLYSALPFTPSSNTFSIESDLKVSRSMSIRTDGGTMTMTASIDSESQDPNTGFVTIEEPKRTSLVFDVPMGIIKDDTISNLDFFSRKSYTNRISGADGIISITPEGTDTFAFAAAGNTGGSLSDTTILNNIICYIRSDSTTNSASGIIPSTVLSLANNNFSVDPISSTRIDVNLGTSGVRADFIITTKVNNAENASTGAIRGKQLIPTNDDFHDQVPYILQAAVFGDSLTEANTGTVVDFTGGKIFPDIGVTFFDQVDVIEDLKTPGVPVSLQVPDVYEIVRIIDSRTNTSNVTNDMLTDPAYDITERYEFDNGQRKGFYDHATITLKRGYSSPTGSNILVQYKYLQHQTAPSPQIAGVFTVDSYLKENSNITYDQITKFNNREDGRLIDLRSCLDFRPTREIGSNTLSGAVNVDPDYTAEFSFDYYIGRIDKIVVKPSRQFSVIQGRSSTNPIPPKVDPADMLLYTLNIPPYTESVKDITVEFENNRRYTMRDIGYFEKRIKGLEYYVALNALEKNAESQKILDNNGLERAKYGILVDNFLTNEVQASYKDVGFDNRCLVENKELQPASLMRQIKLGINPDGCTGNYKIVGNGDKKALMLDYTEATFAQQPYATKAHVIAGALFGNFQGKVKLFPEFVGDVDTGRTAKVVMNSFNGLENAFNFINDTFRYFNDANPQWSDDKNSPFAKIATNSWFTEQSSTSTSTALLNQRGFVQTFGNIQSTTTNTFQTTEYALQQQQLQVSSTQIDVGTFVTDVSIQPYIKPREIMFTAQGLRPGSSFYGFFDGVDINRFIAVPNKVEFDDATNFSVGERLIIANSSGNLATALSNYLSGDPNFDMAVITAKDTATNNVYVVYDTVAEFDLDGCYVYGLDSGETTTATLIEHRSGIGTVTSTTIQLQSEASSVNDYYNGNTIYLIRQTTDADGNPSYEGTGEAFTIVDYVGLSKTVYLDNAVDFDYVNDKAFYSIGRNKATPEGKVSGAFYPPPATFRYGERIFRLTDSFNNSFDKDSVSFCETSYVSSGLKLDKTTLVDTVYNIGVEPKIIGTTTETNFVKSATTSVVTSTWQVDNTPPPSGDGGGDGGGDPTAQTFYIDPVKYPNGLYLSSVDLWFRQVDDGGIPVVIEIRPTVNGAPHTNFWYPESVAIKYPDEITVSENPSIVTSALIGNTATNFEFYSPVFLKPGLYAIVIKTDSPENIIWAAEKGQTTTTGQVVSLNPYVGTLYKSQNSMEYVPVINEDIMFRLNRCVFETGSTGTFSLQSPQLTETYYMDRFRYNEIKLPMITEGTTVVNYSFVSTVLGGVKETTYRPIAPFVTYYMESDDLYPIGFRRKQLTNQGDFTVKIDMYTNDDTVSPLINLEGIYLNSWENFVDQASISSEDFNIISPGTAYSNSDTITITSSTGSGANIRLVVDANGNVITTNVISGGVNYYDDFEISINTSTGSNASIVLNSEYDSSGGPADARYITKAIELADGFDSGDLRVFLAACKQGNSEIKVYYKILSESDGTQFKDRPYQLMECLNPSNTPSKSPTDYREYEYRPSLINNYITYTSDTGVTYDSFKVFAIKIVMLSDDNAIVPKVKDLRIVAVPAE
jgi:hypothetical protein